MKKHDNIAVTGVVALLALIGAVKVAQTACALTALALARWGGWDIAEAAQAAPVILAAAAGGLTIFLQGLYDDDDSYTEAPERHDV